MTRAGRVAAALLLAALCTGCGGSDGSAEPSASPSVTSNAPSLPHRGGLVGAIDSARLVAVCQNVRLAVTAVEGQLPDSSVASALDGVLAAFRQEPAGPELRAAAARWAAVRARVGDAETVRRLQTYCDQQGQ